MENPRQTKLKKRLIDLAARALTNAYAPYSNYPVGAALLDEYGRVHLGANVENAINGASVCAERSAVSALVTAGGKKILAVGVVTTSKQPVPPCGVCRQVLREFGEASTPVFFGVRKGRRGSKSLASPMKATWAIKTLSLSQLLPGGFVPALLSGHRKRKAR